eukprot:Polyplicarium_translucidae@DN2657_c0_g1_i2.p1
MADEKKTSPASSDFEEEESPHCSRRETRRLQLQAKRKGSTAKAEAATAGDAPAEETSRAVEYCDICGYPPGYCEFFATWSQCRESALAKYPHLFTDETPQPTESQLGKHQTRGGAGVCPKKKTDVAPSPGTARVRVRKVIRTRKKAVTQIFNVERFDVELEAAAKTLKKKFACGCAVVKGADGSVALELQGDAEETIAEVLSELWPQIPIEAVQFGGGAVDRGGRH